MNVTVKPFLRNGMPTRLLAVIEMTQGLPTHVQYIHRRSGTGHRYMEKPAVRWAQSTSKVTQPSLICSRNDDQLTGRGKMCANNSIASTEAEVYPKYTQLWPMHKDIYGGGALYP